MKKIILITAVCIIGLAFGVFMKVMTVSASSPEGGCPVNYEPAPSVVYDEVWKPLFGLITVRDNNKYKVGELNFSDGTIAVQGGSPIPLNNAVSGEIENNNIKHLPKLKVTRWRVEGHAHFTK